MKNVYTRLALLVLGLAFAFSVIASSGCQPSDGIQPNASNNYDQKIKGKGKPQPNNLD